MEAHAAPPCLLSIAGFDPSSGAGITADLAVFAAHRCFGVSAITALTVQSTTGVRRVECTPAGLLAETLQCLEDDLPPFGIKIGMLGGLAQVTAVVRYLQQLAARGRLPYVVLDPVLVASSGAELLTVEARKVMLRELLPLVSVVTPNTVELACLTGRTCATSDEIASAAAALSSESGGLSVLVTGGHRAVPDDVLLHAGAYTTLEGTRIDTTATHGTGCALSSALLCGLVASQGMTDAATAAKRYVETAMRLAPPRGSGRGPLHLLWPLLEQQTQ